MKTLTLPLKKQWFDMIKAGIKKEEYREIKPHYIRQFIKFEPLKNDLIRDYNFHRCFDEGEINGIETELLNPKYDVLEFSLPNCGTVYAVGYSDVPHSVEKIHRICDTCMMPVEVKNPWNNKEMKQ